MNRYEVVMSEEELNKRVEGRFRKLGIVLDMGNIGHKRLWQKWKDEEINKIKRRK